ncbi:MAG: hypothetical protein ACI87A_003343 [Planctomycetota bacterium]|jgi:hypothetical protein
MNNKLWIQIEAALDERIDPFDIPEIALALENDAKSKRAVCLMTERLSALTQLRDSRPNLSSNRPRSTNKVLFTAAALLCMSVTAKLVWNTSANESLHLTPLRTIDTLSFVVENFSPPPARLARIVLDPKTITTLTLEGETQ